MKKKIILASALSVLIGLLLAYGQKYDQSAEKLTLNVSSFESTYPLGVPITLNFEIRNTSNSDVWLKGKTIGSGYLTISIANSEKKFKKYNAIQTGGKKEPILLKRGSSLNSSSQILWNATPAENSSNPLLFEETDILTYYAFPKDGNYYVKATLNVYNEGESEQIESEPIQITIKEPVGEDLEVWNKIKDRQDIGFFIQEGYFRTSNPQEVNKLKQEVEQITLKHPNSLLANQIGQSLEKFQANEEKRKAYLEKMKKPQ